MEITGIASLTLAILACVGWYRSYNRISRIEEELALANQKLYEWIWVSNCASQSAHVCWLGLNTIMRHLAAGVPPEQWLTIMEEVRHVQTEPYPGGGSSGQFEAAGPGRATETPEARTTEGDH